MQPEDVSVDTNNSAGVFKNRADYTLKMTFSLTLEVNTLDDITCDCYMI